MFLIFKKTIFTTALLVIFAIITFAFLITWTKNKKRYGKKLSINDDEIIIYDYKNNKIQEFKTSEAKGMFVDVVFDEYPRFKHRKCMIVYIDFVPYNGMEYKSYCNIANIEIIQNSELIEILIKFLNSQAIPNNQMRQGY